MNKSWSHSKFLKNLLAVCLNFIQIYSSNKTKFFPSFYQEIIFYSKKAPCYEDWNTLMHFVSASVVQCRYPGRQNLCSVFTGYRKNIVSQLFNCNASIVCIGVSTHPQKHTPLFLAKPLLKSANCPSPLPLFLGNPP